MIYRPEWYIIAFLHLTDVWLTFSSVNECEYHFSFFFFLKTNCHQRHFPGKSTHSFYILPFPISPSLFSMKWNVIKKKKSSKVLLGAASHPPNPIHCSVTLKYHPFEVASERLAGLIIGSVVGEPKRAPQSCNIVPPSQHSHIF